MGIRIAAGHESSKCLLVLFRNSSIMHAICVVCMACMSMSAPFQAQRGSRKVLHNAFVAHFDYLGSVFPCWKR